MTAPTVLEVVFFFVIFLIIVFVLLLAYFKWCYCYWKNKKVPCVPPKFPWGNFEDTFNGKFGAAFVVKKYYDEFKQRAEKHGGVYIFSSPTYIPVDPEYVKNILTKDFQYFTDRGFYYNEKDDPLSTHLFSLDHGAKWKNLRNKFTNMFSPAKIKGMIQLLDDCGRNLEATIEEHCQNLEAIDIKKILSAYSTDIVVSCAFGIECNSLKEQDNPFVIYGIKFLETTLKRRVKTLFACSFPNLARALGFLAIPADVSRFYLNTIKDTIKKRNENNTTRKDFLQLLIDLQKNQEEKIGGRLTIEQIAAQCTIFLVAGYESTSTTLTFCIYELCLNQNIQEKVREEIKSTLDKNNGEITYDCLTEMKYTEQVINETLRKYPPAPALPRLCVKDYKTPDGTILEKGTKIFIPILGLHRDPEHFPDPETFDPERFRDDNKKHIAPFTYIPFGEGPRICIAQKFGIMECKMALIHLLKNHRFSLNEKTGFPLKLNAGNLGIITENKIYLNATKC